MRIWIWLMPCMEGIWQEKGEIVSNSASPWGAMLLGASVMGTIKGKILNTSLYKDKMDALMHGILTPLVIAFFIPATANTLFCPCPPPTLSWAQQCGICRCHQGIWVDQLGPGSQGLCLMGGCPPSSPASLSLS